MLVNQPKEWQQDPGQSFAFDDVKNLNEAIVFDELVRLFEGELSQNCACGICVQDIAAIALNALPAHYYTNMWEYTEPVGERAKWLDALHQQVRQELRVAADKVKHNPHH